MRIKEVLAKILYQPIRAGNILVIRFCLYGRQWKRPIGQIPLADLGRVLVLAPHVDDEVIGLGSLLGKIDYSLAYITDSSASWGMEDAGPVRAQEARRLHQHLGARQVYFLQGKNGDLTKDLERLRLDLAKILDAYDTIFTPALTDAHPEHRQTTRLLTGLVREGQQVYLYEGSNLLPSDLINSCYRMTREEWRAKGRLYDFFPSQKAMDFDIYQQLNKYKGRLVSAGAAEFFCQLSSCEFEAYLAGQEEEILKENFRFRLGNHRSFYKVYRQMLANGEIQKEI